MPLTKFEVDTSDPVRPILRVDGQEVPGVTRVTVDHRGGEIPTVYVELGGTGEAGGLGAVELVAPVVDSDSLVAWLQSVDVTALEKRVLEILDFGTPMAVSWLTALQEVAQA